MGEKRQACERPRPALVDHPAAQRLETATMRTISLYGRGMNGRINPHSEAGLFQGATLTPSIHGVLNGPLGLDSNDQ